MSQKVLVCWSGGKNSTRAIMEYHQRGYEVTAVCYIPMFTKEIPLIDKEVYQFILDCTKLFRSWGIHVVLLKNGVTYYDWCAHICVKGKHKGKRQGFPLFFKGKCGFAKAGKVACLKAYFKRYAHRFSFTDIGLCADETDRMQLKGRERSILQELGIKDIECFYWCRDHHLLSPKYKRSMRDGCLLCPHARRVDRYVFFKDYPEAVELVKQLQRYAMERGYYPLPGKHWFIENEEFVCGNGSQLSCLSSDVYY